MFIRVPTRAGLAILVLIGSLLAALSARAAAPASNMAVTISAQQADAQRYRVTFRCDRLAGESHDFKMPVWTPGYYQLMNYAKHVEDFRAADGDGNLLAWEKVDPNTWRVESGDAVALVVSYDVRAVTRFVAESYLDHEQGYISPASVFMYVAGHLQHPVTVAVKPLPSWKDVATGLEPVAGEPLTFSATDFDTLYDCPILMGNLETIRFDVQGIPHSFVGRNLGSFDRTEFTASLTRMIESAVTIIGHIPYRHYTILAIGPGRGGIEHANSMAISFEGGNAVSPTRNDRWMGFMAHEFFHLYNAKRIRPIELGPFDYGQENRTNMLWVAEGFTVYYQALILKRAGIIDREDVFDSLSGNIRGYESRPGHLVQSATQASYDTWRDGPFGGDPSTTISCYAKGAALGMLLDFKIRHETKNQKSLDDVMRTLYRDYYQQQDRGYTEQEFREVCERVAGGPLPEVFSYASTVDEIDYSKYLGYAGLEIEMTRGDEAEQRFRIKPLPNPDPLQAAILADWLGEP